MARRERRKGQGSMKTQAGVTRQEATAWLMNALGRTERVVDRLITLPLTDNQFGALMSFTYNAGSGNLAASTLRAKLNRGDYESAVAEFPKWRFAKGKVLAGLERIAFKLNRNTAPTFYFISITLIVLGSLRIGLCSSQTARGGTRLVRE
ncbi:MAG: lysozyme, partial [Hyphomicrobiales bacterium]